MSNVFSPSMVHFFAGSIHGSLKDTLKVLKHLPITNGRRNVTMNPVASLWNSLP